MNSLFCCLYIFIKYGSVPLGIAAVKGHTETVQRLLELGANPNQQNKVITDCHIIIICIILPKCTYPLFRVQWMMATYFELTSLARIKVSPHKPYIVATFTVGLVKCENNGERILYVDGQEHSIVKLVS